MKQEQLVISYPRMGNYHIPIERALSILFPDAEVLPPLPITAKTLELGSKYSPESVCSPFKFNVGNFIEALEQGSNVLLQTGLGCIFGYYGELQEQILKDLGYDFHFLCFSRGNVSINRAFKTYRELGGGRSLSTLARTTLYVLGSMRAMDRFEYTMRENMAFETYVGAHAALHNKLLDDLREVSIGGLASLWQHYRRELSNIALEKPNNRLRIGLVGDLYTLMEPCACFNLEHELINSGCSISRKMNASFLCGSHKKASLHTAKDYLTRSPGANGADSVAQTVAYARLGYDGIIHMKAFGCTPELNATPALNNVSRDMGIPILHLSFDTHTGETGMQTRLEAFIDMLKMRKNGIPRFVCNSEGLV